MAGVWSESDPNGGCGGARTARVVVGGGEKCSRLWFVGTVKEWLWSGE